MKHDTASKRIFINFELFKATKEKKIVAIIDNYTPQVGHYT